MKKLLMFFVLAIAMLTFGCQEEEEPKPVLTEQEESARGITIGR